MRAHTVLVLDAAIGSQTLAELTDVFQSPVLAFCCLDGASTRPRLVVDATLDEGARRSMASTTFDLYRRVAMPAGAVEPRALTRERLVAIHRAVEGMERALGHGDSDEEDLVEAAQHLSAEAERLALGLAAWEAEQ